MRRRSKKVRVLILAGKTSNCFIKIKIIVYSGQCAYLHPATSQVCQLNCFFTGFQRNFSILHYFTIALFNSEVISKNTSLCLYVKRPHIKYVTVILIDYFIVPSYKVTVHCLPASLAPVVQRLGNAIHRINRYPADKC